MKKLSVLFLSLFLALNVFAVEQIYVGAPKAPPVLPVLRMMETNALGKDYKIDVKVWNSPEILIKNMVANLWLQSWVRPLSIVSIYRNMYVEIAT